MLVVNSGVKEITFFLRVLMILIHLLNLQYYESVRRDSLNTFTF